MKLNIIFTIVAIVLILMGLLSFFAPPSLAGTDPSAGFSAKIIGVFSIALGVLAWQVRNDGPSKTRGSIVAGYILLFALWAAVSVYGLFLTDMPAHNISWGPALIQALLAIGLFMAGRTRITDRVSQS